MFDLKTLGIPDDGYPYEICVAWESEQELSSGVCLYNSENFGLQFRGNVLIQQDFMPIYADKVFKARTIYGSILTSYIKLIACRRLGKQIQEEN